MLSKAIHSTPIQAGPFSSSANLSSIVPSSIHLKIKLEHRPGSTMPFLLQVWLFFLHRHSFKDVLGIEVVGLHSLHPSRSLMPCHRGLRCCSLDLFLVVTSSYPSSTPRSECCAYEITSNMSWSKCWSCWARSSAQNSSTSSSCDRSHCAKRPFSLVTMV